MKKIAVLAISCVLLVAAVAGNYGSWETARADNGAPSGEDAISVETGRAASRDALSAPGLFTQFDSGPASGIRRYEDLSPAERQYMDNLRNLDLSAANRMYQEAAHDSAVTAASSQSQQAIGTTGLNFTGVIP